MGQPRHCKLRETSIRIFVAKTTQRRVEQDGDRTRNFARCVHDETKFPSTRRFTPNSASFVPIQNQAASLQGFLKRKARSSRQNTTGVRRVTSRDAEAETELPSLRRFTTNSASFITIKNREAASPHA